MFHGESIHCSIKYYLGQLAFLCVERYIVSVCGKKALWKKDLVEKRTCGKKTLWKKGLVNI